MRWTHVVMAAALAMAVAACGSSGSGTPDSGIGDDCTGSVTRCVGSSYQVCHDGHWSEEAVCQEPQVCAQGHGCVACNPAAGTVCVGNEVHTCNADGTIGGLVQTCVTSSCWAGACTTPQCSPESQLIYVVDDEYRLLSFNPLNGANEFHLLGTLSCPAGSSWPGWGGTGPATPFSMAVDRSAHCWVLYTSGQIFKVDATSANLPCSNSGFTPGQAGFELFGMGFVSDEAGSEEETLFIAGGPADEPKSGDVASVDPGDLIVHTLGPIPSAENSPELTGTGNAKFYGYFPGSTTTFVSELNKTSGALVAGQRWNLPGLGAAVRAWAFAHWGGKFYIFVTVASGISLDSRVLRLDPATGQTDTLLTGQPYIIVGAGVSTCAPVVEP